MNFSKKSWLINQLQLHNAMIYIDVVATNVSKTELLNKPSSNRTKMKMTFDITKSLKKYMYIPILATFQFSKQNPI